MNKMEEEGEKVVKLASALWPQKSNLPTFHTILHIAEDVLRLGVPVNHMAGKLEGQHKYAKKMKFKT